METHVTPRWRSPRRLLTAVAAMVALSWLAMVALRAPELPDFRGGGEPIALPPGEVILDADVEALQGMLAGQLGQVVVINLWASWCAPCRAEMPLLQAASTEYRGSAVFLGVASNDQRGAADRFLTDVGVTYPNVFDVDGSIARALDVSVYPTTYVIGVDGEIRARVDGGISEQRLAGLVRSALE